MPRSQVVRPVRARTGATMTHRPVMRSWRHCDMLLLLRRIVGGIVTDGNPSLAPACRGP